MANDEQIGYVSITRKETLKSTRMLHNYEWYAEFRRIKSDGRPGKRIVRIGGEIRHRYDRGWGPLVAKVLAQINTGYMGNA